MTTSPPPSLAMAAAAVGLASARRRLAAAVGHAARGMWKRKDLTVADEVVMDLLVEALHRMGNIYRPRSGQPAVAAIAVAPPHIAELVAKLEPIATRGVQRGGECKLQQWQRPLLEGVAPQPSAEHGQADGGPRLESKLSADAAVFRPT